MSVVSSALFVDYDNAQGLIKGAQLSSRLSNWLSWLEDGQFDPKKRQRRFLIKSAYWHPTHKLVEPVFQQAGFLTRECVYVAGSKERMSAVDLYLAIDVMDAVTRMRSIDEVVIFATDSDYFPLISTLRARDVKTAIIVSHQASKIYEAEADIPIPAASLTAAYDYVRPAKRSLFGISPFSPATSAIPQPPPRGALSAAKPAPASAEIARQQRPGIQSFDDVAQRFADFVATKKRPLQAGEIVSALKNISPGLKTSGSGAFLGRENLVVFLTEVAKLTGRIKLFWMGPGKLAVRATRPVGQA